MGKRHHIGKLHLWLASLGLGALLAWATPAMAADMMQFYRQAQANDSTYLTALHQRDAARNAYKQLRALLLPNISLSANSTHTNTSDTSGYTVSLNQPLLDVPALAQWHAGRYAMLQAEANYANAQQGLIIRLAQAYFNVLAAQDELALAEAEKHALSQQLVLVKQRLHVGLGTLTEVHETQARYDTALANELLAQNTLSDTISALNEIAPGQDIYLAKLQEHIPLLGPEPNTLDTWLQQAKVSNPTLQAAIEGEAAAKATYDAALGGYLPSVNLSAQKIDDTGSPGITDRVAITFTLPLFQSGLQKAAVGAARDNWLAAQAQRQQAERAVERQIRQAFQGLQASILRVNALKQAMISSQNALDATIAGMEVGTRTNLDVLNSRQDLFRTRRDYAQSRYDYLMYRLRLKQAAGTLDENDLLSINQLTQS